MEDIKEKNRLFALLGIYVLNTYNQEGITDREFLTKVIPQIRTIKEALKVV